MGYNCSLVVYNIKIKEIVTNFWETHSVIKQSLK